MKGQPRAFETEDDFKEAFNNYIDYCIKNDKLANIAGFCVFSDICRDTFYAQEDYYSYTFKKIQNILEDYTINAKINDTFKIFYMKNKFQYRDRQEIDNTIRVDNKLDDILKAVE